MSDLTKWAEHQLDQAGYRTDEDSDRQFVGAVVMELVYAHERFLTTRRTPEIEKQVAHLFNELLNHRALPVHADTSRWVPARQYPTSLGNRMKVRPDAFPGAVGLALNGRACRLQAVRRGEYIVGFDDGNIPETARLKAEHLLVLVP